jgi:hypothetical protein
MQKYKRVQINKTLTLLDKLSEESNKLYNVCKEENVESIVTPSIWLLNQDTMREKWDEYYELLDKVTDGSKEVLMNSSLAKYMSFMYDSYPEGFGKKLFEYCEKEECISNKGKGNMKYHAAEIYLSLTEKA